MLTIKYQQHSGLIETWEDQLKALVMAYQLIQDETIETPILTNESETAIGTEAISKYVEALAEYQAAWFACACK